MVNLFRKPEATDEAVVCEISFPHGDAELAHWLLQSELCKLPDVRLLSGASVHVIGKAESKACKDRMKITGEYAAR